MSIINYKDGRPIYEQIAGYYRRLILKGILGEDEQMPSVRSLAMELSTNPNTVQKAYQALIAEGYLYTVSGRGNFVAEAGELRRKKREDLKRRFAGLVKEAKELGMDPKELWPSGSGPEDFE